MATLNIKNLPDSLHRRLQKRAELHHRSVAQEVTHILEEIARTAGTAVDPLVARTGQGPLEGRRRRARAEGTAGVGLIEDIGDGPVALDTAVFIYFIEENPRFLPCLEPLFASIASGGHRAVTSALTLLEVLVVPFRVGNVSLADRMKRC